VVALQYQLQILSLSQEGRPKGSRIFCKTRNNGSVIYIAIRTSARSETLVDYSTNSSIIDVAAVLYIKKICRLTSN
jgi:hypothetical protein